MGSQKKIRLRRALRCIAGRMILGQTWVHLAIQMLEIHMGLWCSGITSASHAEGPEFKPRRFHWFLLEFGYKVLDAKRRTKTKKCRENFYGEAVMLQD